jgi:hypothetical protein
VTESSVFHCIFFTRFVCISVSWFLKQTSPVIYLQPDFFHYLSMFHMRQRSMMFLIRTLLILCSIYVCAGLHINDAVAFLERALTPILFVQDFKFSQLVRQLVHLQGQPSSPFMANTFPMRLDASSGTPLLLRIRTQAWVCKLPPSFARHHLRDLLHLSPPYLLSLMETFPRTFCRGHIMVSNFRAFSKFSTSSHKDQGSCKYCRFSHHQARHWGQW